MTCEELKDSLSAYVDDELTPHTRAVCDGHLEMCPFCRAELADTRLLARRFATLSRPAPPTDLAFAISNRLHTERAVLIQTQGHKNVAPLLSPARLLAWIAPRVMPFSIGAFASVILFFAVLGALLPAMRSLHVIEQTSLLEFAAANDEGGFDVTQPITAADYVASRTPFTVVSPSLDPRGALATAAASDEDQMDEDDMLLVADVYSDGQASVAEIVTPPRDARMLSDLEAAFRRNPAFVPARLDHRPPTMRVVFMVQRMNVRDTVY